MIHFMSTSQHIGMSYSELVVFSVKHSNSQNSLQKFFDARCQENGVSKIDWENWQYEAVKVTFIFNV